MSNGLAGNNNEQNQTPSYDIAILGTGMTGTLLATILSRQNCRVVIIDAAIHPRFAIGEAGLPYFSKMLDILADRFDVPELKYLATWKNVQKYVTSSCGIKRNIGFVYHREGRLYSPYETNQAVIPDKILGAEKHLFRQDIDAFLFYTAVHYGAKPMQRVKLTDVQMDDQGVTLTIGDNTQIAARYVVDTSGPNSFLAQKFGLHETPTRLKTQSRTIYTHMVLVKPFEQCASAQYANGKNEAAPSPWSQGSLSHLFDGGWMWVLPFDNYKGSSNLLCSVGLNLDMRRYPKTDLAPANEFQQFLSCFPSIAHQFADARSVREWVATERQQYSTTRCFGPRYCVIDQAAGYVDELFARPLANTVDIVNSLAGALLEAVRANDFSSQRFAHVEQLQHGILDYNDQLASSAYTAMVDFNLWNAWFKVWALGMGLGELRTMWSHLRYQSEKDPSYLASLDDVPYPGLIFPIYDRYKQYWDMWVATMDEVANKTLAPTEATERILKLLDDANLIAPVHRVGDPTNRHVQTKPANALKVFSWAKSSAPEEIRHLFLETSTAILRKALAGQPV